MGVEEDKDQPRRIVFEGSVIYMLNKDEDLATVLKNLNHIVNSVINDDDNKKLLMSIKF